MGRGRVIAACLTIAAAVGCGGSGSGPTAGSPDSPGLATSHNPGRNCLACHRELTTAGTVYRPDAVTTLPAAVVRLTTAPDGGGTIVATLTSDGSGNFRTAQAIAFGSGLYADVTGPSGARTAKKGTITSGACNSCHDASRRITAN